MRNKVNSLVLYINHKKQNNMVERKVIYLLFMYKNHYNQQVLQNIEQK